MSQPPKAKPKAVRKALPLVYLVDDETLLLDVAEAALASAPVRLKKFDDPEKALRSFREDKHHPAVLVCDYAMGKMNGLELIAQCKQANPALRAILVSGTVGAEIVVNSPVKVDRFFAKPYQPSVLLEAVQQLAAGGE